MKIYPRVIGGKTSLSLLSYHLWFRFSRLTIIYCPDCRFSNENFPNILKLVSVLEDVGKKYNATASQITLAWLLAQGDDIIPIPGTKKIKVRYN